MRSPLMALLWERWRRTRLVILLTFLFLFLISLAFAMGANPPRTDNVVYSVLLLTAPFLFGFLLLSHCDRDDIYLGFPRRLLRLPRTTRALVAVQMGYGLGVLAAFTVVLCVALRWTAEAWAMDDWLGFLIVLEGTFLYAQTLAWLFGPLSLVGTLILGLVLYAPTVASLAYMLSWPHCSLRQIALVFVAFATLCYMVSVAAVALQRRGTWQTGMGVLVSQLLSYRDARRKPFRSALDAQIWYEWRRKGFFFPVLFGSVGALFLGAAMFADPMVTLGFGHSYMPYRVIEPIVYLMFIMAYGSGLFWFASDNRDRSMGLGNFLFVRPVPTRTLAAARLYAAFRGIRFAGILLLLFFVLLHTYWFDRVVMWCDAIGGQEHAMTTVVQLTCATVLSGIGVMACTWVNTLLAVPMALAAGGCLLIALLLEGIGVFSEDLMFIILNVLGVAASFVGTLAVFRAAWRRGLVRSRTLTISVLTAPLVAMSLVALLCWNGGRSDPDEFLMAALGFTPLAFLPFGLIPLLLHRERHR